MTEEVAKPPIASSTTNELFAKKVHTLMKSRNVLMGTMPP
jgi:hypothetical protein